MAPADAGDFILDKDDDDFFVEYNPHPYRGGYDIAATFGTPLPPSTNICYPVSSSAAATAVPTVPSPPSPTPEPEEPCGDEEAQREPVQESPVVFPNGAATKGKVRRGGWCGRGFWRKCLRGLDYLSGYKDPYAQQRIGVDSYVAPVYANRKQSGEDSLAVEAEAVPPALGRVEPHGVSKELVRSNGLSWHSNYGNEANSYSQSMSNSYNTLSFAQSYGLHGVLGKPGWFPSFSYSESDQVEEFQHEALSSYIFGNPIYCYHHHCYKQALNVQHFSIYCDQSDVNILETPAHACSIQSYTPTYDVPLEPFKPSWSQIWGLYDPYTQGDALENDTCSIPSDEYGGFESLFMSPFYPRETEMFDQAPGDELASFQHNRHNLSYQNVYIDDVPLITQQV